MIATSHSKGVQQLAKALGIGERCMGFTLICKPDNIIRLHVTYAVTEDQVLRAVEVFEKYRLEEQQ